MILHDRVLETSQSTGTAAFTLLGAKSCYQSFNDTVGVGNQTFYVIENPFKNQFEVGTGTLSSATTLVRTSVIVSSNANQLVSFTSGTKNVFQPLPADYIIHSDATYSDPPWIDALAASKITGAIGTSQGGTGLTTIGSAGTVLSSSGTSATWSTVSSTGTPIPGLTLLGNPYSTVQPETTITASGSNPGVLGYIPTQPGANKVKFTYAAPPGGVFTFDSGLPRFWDKLPVLLGGTGADNAQDASTNLLPSQAAASGLYLRSDGTLASWQTVTSGVTSVALAMPSIMPVSSGSPITSSGTLTVTLAPVAGNQVLSGPTTTGTATPAFRALVAADIPSIDLLLPSETGNAGKYLTTSGTVASWSTVPVGGTVTSVSLSLPSILPVTSATVTTSGTLTATLAPQSANKVFAGGTSGTAAVAPTFRALVAADIPSIDLLLPSETGNSGKYLGTDGTVASWSTVSSGSSPGGVSGNLQYNASGTLAGFSSSTVSSAGTMMKIQAATATAVPFVAKGAVSQTGDLQEWQNSGGGVLSWADSAGRLHSPQYYITDGGLTDKWHYSNSANGFEVVETGVASLRWVIAPGGKVSIGTGSATGRFHVVTVANQTGVVVQGAAAQSANLQEWQNSSGTAVAAVLTDGTLQAKGFPIMANWALALGAPAATGTNVTNNCVVPRASVIKKCWASAKTGPTGTLGLVCDINLNGTSIWSSTQSNRIAIAAGAVTGTQTAFDTTTCAEGDTLTLDIDQVGSTVAAQDISVQLLLSSQNT